MFRTVVVANEHCMNTTFLMLAAQCEVYALHEEWHTARREMAYRTASMFKLFAACSTHMTA